MEYYSLDEENPHNSPLPTILHHHKPLYNPTYPLCVYKNYKKMNIQVLIDKITFVLYSTSFSYV